jgi:catechol 2,3-dioxygenase-like lactoylglutathione lyase family enzyme
MGGDSAAPRAEFRRVVPDLPVREVAAAVRFWTDVLGFRVGYTSGQPPVYAVVARDDVEIALHAERGPAHRAGHARCYIKVTNVQAAYDEFRARGVRVLQELSAHSYGLKDFVIADSDGNQIGVGGV